MYKHMYMCINTWSSSLPLWQYNFNIAKQLYTYILLHTYTYIYKYCQLFLAQSVHIPSKKKRWSKYSKSKRKLWLSGHAWRQAPKQSDPSCVLRGNIPGPVWYTICICLPLPSGILTCGKSPFIVSFPIRMVIFHSHVSFPEGIPKSLRVCFP